MSTQYLSPEGADVPQSTFDKVVAQQAEAQTAEKSIANIYKAYRDGRMTAEQSAAFEADVKSGVMMLPPGATLSKQSQHTPGEPHATSESTPLEEGFAQYLASNPMPSASPESSMPYQSLSIFVMFIAFAVFTIRATNRRWQPLKRPMFRIWFAVSAVWFVAVTAWAIGIVWWLIAPVLLAIAMGAWTWAKQKPNAAT